MPDALDIWQPFREHLRAAVGDSTFSLWLESLEPAGVADGTILIAAPDTSRTWVADRYGRVLDACAAAVMGPGTRAEIVRPDAARRPPGALLPPAAGLNPKYTFSQFVIGAPNRLAHAAALAVAELPGSAYNPLFIYGPPGVGKTHLLHSIADYIARYGSGLTVRYATIEQFTNGFLQALRGGGLDTFKAHYRHNDVLLIDDIQYLESKARTEEEFFHTFNALYEAGSQLVLTCDRMPRDLGALEERLRERFESGLVTDIAAPDHDMRLAILRKRVQHDGIAVADPAALDLIAERVPDNVRALEGALIRVVAHQSLTGRPLDVDLAEKVLEGQGRQAVALAGDTLDSVQDAACAAFGVSREDLLGDSRAASVTWPRQLAMYLARERTGKTLPAIGRAFGGRNHTTVLHACRRTRERIAQDPDAQADLDRLTTMLDDRGH